MFCISISTLHPTFGLSSMTTDMCHWDWHDEDLHFQFSSNPSSREFHFTNVKCWWSHSHIPSHRPSFLSHPRSLQYAFHSLTPIPIKLTLERESVPVQHSRIVKKEKTHYRTMNVFSLKPDHLYIFPSGTEKLERLSGVNIEHSEERRKKTIWQSCKRKLYWRCDHASKKKKKLPTRSHYYSQNIHSILSFSRFSSPSPPPPAFHQPDSQVSGKKTACWLDLTYTLESQIPPRFPSCRRTEKHSQCANSGFMLNWKMLKQYKSYGKRQYDAILSCIVQTSQLRFFIW